MRSTTKRSERLRPALVVTGGGAAVLIFAVLLRLPTDKETISPPSSAPAPAPRPVAAPVASPAPAPNAAGLRLYGLLGRGAVIALPDGRQRFFALGRDVQPGLHVARIEQQHVILASAGGEVRLGFDGPTPMAAAPATTRPAGPAAADDDVLRDATLRYRLGLAPRLVKGRAQGFVVRPGADMPALARAGLRAGDLITRVNGSGFDEDRMLELSWQIANETHIEFEVERGGRRLRLVASGGHQ